MSTNYQHVNYLWDDAVADQLDPVERLRYRSNLLGTDQRITNTGGGNTSSKLLLPDPLTGETVDVMVVKGSGGDLRTAKREFCVAVYGQIAGAAQDMGSAENKGVKTEIEDAMAGMYHIASIISTRAPAPSTHLCTVSFPRVTSTTRIPSPPLPSPPAKIRNKQHKTSMATKSATSVGSAPALIWPCHGRYGPRKIRRP